ncbi:MAG: aminoglycoside phosphotransferase family protein [Crocinitomicaceae bacterium]|nr:aminoglycoside phosphotransferase family protein [Crocinitomicaceae bacterium]
MSVKRNNSSENRIDQEKGLFIKKAPQDKLNNEYQMSSYGYELSQNSKLFQSPKPIVLSKGELSFELLKDISPLRSFFIKTIKENSTKEALRILKSHFVQLGKVLADIHSGENSNGLEKKAFPSDFFNSKWNQDDVTIHGDFTTNNVLFNSNNEGITIIDWSISPIFDFVANQGPRYWDITVFLSSLFLSSIKTYFKTEIRVELAKVFIESYIEASNIKEVLEFKRNLSEFLLEYHLYKVYKGKIDFNDSLIMGQILIPKTIKTLKQLAKSI